LTSLESRLVPYFFIDHPTRGALAGPFRKLSNPPSSSSPESSTSTRPVGFLVLDLAATLLGLDKTSISGGVSKDAESLEKAVGLSFGGENAAPGRDAMATEMRKYWENALLMMKRQNC
jgi:pre-rRNA-processing protein IPI1